MKISKLFHWLYASIMFLPLLVAPLFAIYSHRHTIDSYQVNYAQNGIVDFNQLNNYNTSGSTNGLDYTFTNSNIKISGSSNSSTSFALTVFDKPITNHKYLIRNGYYNTGCRFTNNNAYDDEISGYDVIFHCGNDNYNNYWLISSSMYEISIDFNEILSVFDLTQMFGFGNEPTIAEFNSYFPNDYYEYTLSKKVLLKDVNTITYNDTDIGSQFTYQMYNITDKYLNFDNVLGLGQINDWLLLNVFNANAPLFWSILWHFLEYWLLVSIFWLCFDVLIYVPQLAHRWLDKASLE